MSDRQRVALVTGANRGIGLEIVRRLAAQGLTVLLAARELAKAEEAARKLATDGGRVLPRQLDVTGPESVSRLARSVEDEFGGLDVLVNNAGVLFDREGKVLSTDLNVVRQTLETNLYGPWRLCQAFVPQMKRRGYGRIVNLSSQLGQLEGMGTGYPAYRVSKTALNALTRMLADELRGTNILVNSACPGWVKTDMGGQEAPGTVEQGADTPVWLATLPDGGPSGGFFQNRKPIAW
jgi:NAD(P)-dependent dehydrogenase (short-subunit alcohol dehydrogenase family)